MEGLCLKKNISSSSIVSHIKGALQQLCKELDKYQDTNVSEFLQISVEQDGIYLNAEKIIDKKAKLQYSVFLVLVEHYSHEVINGPSYISSSEICSKLLERYKIDIDEQRLRILIYKMRLSFKRTTNSQLIVSENWHGYRLHGDIMIGRPHIN